MKHLILVMIILLLLFNSIIGLGNLAEEMNGSSKITFSPENIAYGYCIHDPNGQLNEGPVRFNFDDPGNITQLWGTTSSAPMIGATWTYGGWYCCESGSGKLWRIDLDSGYMIEIGGGGVHLNGLEWFDIGEFLGCSNTSLYEIEEDTGEQTLICSFDFPEGRIMGDIVEDHKETCWYGIEIVSNELYQIDIETGDIASIGPLGIEINGTSQIDWSIEDGELYLSTFTTEGGLYKLDKYTGQATLLGEFQGGAEISAFTIDPDRFYHPTANFSWIPKNPEPGETIVFNASSSYVEGEFITFYEWDWDYDLIFDENSTNPITSHIFNDKGFYPVTLLVYDDDNYIDSQCYILNVGNSPPNSPTIDGPIRGKIVVEHEYTFNATDPDDDPVMYIIEWTNNNTEWTEYVDSDKEIKLNHTWYDKGIYTIKAKARDCYNEESDWTYLEVTMSHSYNNPVGWLNSWLDRFPLLQRLLEVLTR